MLTKEEILEALAESLLPLEVISYSGIDNYCFCPELKQQILLSLERGRDIIRRNYDEKMVNLLNPYMGEYRIYSDDEMTVDPNK